MMNTVMCLSALVSSADREDDVLFASQLTASIHTGRCAGTGILKVHDDPRGKRRTLGGSHSVGVVGRTLCLSPVGEECVSMISLYIIEVV